MYSDWRQLCTPRSAPNRQKLTSARKREPYAQGVNLHRSLEGRQSSTHTSSPYATATQRARERGAEAQIPRSPARRVVLFLFPVLWLFLFIGYYPIVRSLDEQGAAWNYTTSYQTSRRKRYPLSPAQYSGLSKCPCVEVGGRGRGAWLGASCVAVYTV